MLHNERMKFRVSTLNIVMLTRHSVYLVANAAQEVTSGDDSPFYSSGLLRIRYVVLCV